MLNQQDEIMLFNTDKLNVHKLERSTDPLGIENIVDIVIPQYYNLKIIHSKKMVEHYSEKQVNKYHFHHNQKKHHHNVKTVDDIIKTANSAVNKSAPNQKSKEKVKTINDSNSDDESHLVVATDLVLPPVIETKELELTEIVTIETKNDLSPSEIQEVQDKSFVELNIHEPIQNQNISSQKPTKKKPKIKKAKKESFESVKQTEPNLVEEQSLVFLLKTFGKIKTTVDILLEKKELAKAQTVLNNQQEDIQSEQLLKESKSIEKETEKVKPNLGKVFTTVENLIKDKKNKTFENKNLDKLAVLNPIVQESPKKENSRLARLKAIEKAPPGTIIVGLKDVKTNNQEQKIKKVDFTKPKKKQIDKSKFKKDLEIEETKELKITMYDILDKDKK